jgi:opacity protein-like surface antigen
MKKIVIIFVLFFGVLSTSQAQVLFNTAQSLQKGNWSIGINPVYADYGDGDFALFFHGGYGLGNSSDIGLKLGFGWNEAYVGLDYEKTLLSGKPSVSLFGGAHYWHDFGLDLGSTVTFPIGNVNISTGLDLDIVFGKDVNDDLELRAPLWLPISLEVYLQKHLSLVFEGNIKLTHSAFTTVGGGINIYF